MMTKIGKRILITVGILSVILVGTVLSRDLWMPHVMPLLYVGEALYSTMQTMEEALEQRIEAEDFMSLLEEEGIQHNFALQVNQLNDTVLYNPLAVDGVLRKIPGQYSIEIMLNDNQTVALNGYMAGDEIGINIPSVGSEYWSIKGSQFAEDFNASTLRKLLFMDEVGETFNWQGLSEQKDLEEERLQKEKQEAFVKQLGKDYLKEIQVEQQPSQLAYGVECRAFQVGLDEAQTKALLLDITDYMTQVVDLEPTQEVALLTEGLELANTTDTIQQSIVEVSQTLKNLKSIIETSHYGEGIVMDVLIDNKGIIREVSGRLNGETAQNKVFNYEGNIALQGEELLTDAMSFYVQNVQDEQVMFRAQGQIGLRDGKEEMIVAIQELNLEIAGEEENYDIGLDGEIRLQELEAQNLKPSETKEILKLNFQEYQEILGGLIRWFFNLQRVTRQ